ncbi:MAG TPA: VWA domain-containing protein [Spirochaetales bacterium]|nr:VWA domain-containing protein [Spirochaetales bacterium]
MPGFADPLALLLLPLPLLFLAAAAFLSRVGGGAARADGYRLPLFVWGADGGVPSASGFRRAARLASRASFALAYAAAAVAAAGPYTVEHRSFWLSRGADVVFVLDVSPSMAARDIEPDRLSAAKALVRSYLEAGRTEAVGVVIFGREAALLAPPSADHGAVAARLEEAQPGVLGDGTAVGLGLAVAVRHVHAARGLVDRVVLVTDGENNAGAVAPEDAAELARRYGVELVVVGVGGPGEADIVYRDPATGRTVSGAYASSFDESALEDLAARAGGAYFSAADSAALARAFDWAAERSAGSAGRRSVERRLDRSRAWLLLVAAFAAAAWLLSRAANGGAE